jgi:PD-(D/E)XK nuclease superfamily
MSAPERYSYSLMERGENCLLAARFSRETQIDGPASVLGRLFHEAAGSALNAHFLGTSPKDAYLRAIEESDEPQSLAHYRAAMDLFDTWWPGLVLVENPLTWMVEQPYEHTLQGYRLSCRIDLIQVYERDGMLVCQIDDHKSGRLLPTQEDFDAKLQTFLYAWHVAQEIKVGLFDVGEVYARYGVRRSRVFRPDELSIERYLIAAARRLEQAWAKDEFPPTPGAHCSICPSPQLCPVKETAPVVEDEGAAMETLREIAKTDARSKALKGLLKGWVAENGAVTAGGMVARLAHTSSERVDKGRLGELGVDLEQVTKRSDYTRFEVVKERK